MNMSSNKKLKHSYTLKEIYIYCRLKSWEVRIYANLQFLNFMYRYFFYVVFINNVVVVFSEQFFKMEL